MDVLTDVMQTVRVQSHLYGRLELGAPWGMEFGACDRPGFFIVSRGSCWLEVTGIEEQVPLAGGDFVFLPKGRGHALRDAPDTPTVPVDEVFKDCPGSGQVLRHGGGGVPVSLVCGCFLFEDGGRNPLVESLPPMIHVRSDGGASVRWLEMTLQFMASETASTLPGAETVASRLADILFVHAVRAHIAAAGSEVSGWLEALADPQIGEALRKIHEAPQDPWSVETLAASVSMSRSAFAARFTALVGEPPLRYVTAWRMKKASHRLLQGEPIAAIAQATGYENDAAFGKAFKRFMGSTPGEFRRRARETELEPAH
jgi:AraC-like DNA-binding protein